MALDVLVQRGIDRMDCVHKIVRKYGVNFTILRERNISGRGGLFGLFPRDRVEVEFYLSSQLQVRPPQPQAMSQGQLMQQNGTYGRSGQNESPASAGEDNTLDFLESRKKVIAASGRDPEKIIRDIRKSEEDADDRQAILAQLKELGETNKLLLARAERKKGTSHDR
jgi:flagellar biosynthesis GTPase FlhF